MVGTGAAGASPSGLLFCTSIPPGRTSHSSSLAAAAAAAGGGGAELSFIAAAAGGNVPFALARIIFSWHAHAHATNLPNQNQSQPLPQLKLASYHCLALQGKNHQLARASNTQLQVTANWGREWRIWDENRGAAASVCVCVQVLDAGLNWGNQDQAAER
uniref:Uncharacterized protein n=1 Tax=Oryza glumipatula TaxID=40148 RepID=A0A0E0B5I3_9ORYZ